MRGSPTARVENHPRSILLVRLSALGDCVHAVPVAWALRRAFPRAKIGWAIQPGPFALLEGLGCIDRFHVLPRRASLGERVAALRALRRERYEVVLDLQGLAKSALVTFASGAPRRLGWAGPESREGNRLALTERLAVPADISHVVDRNLALLGLLGIEQPAVCFDLPLYPSAAATLESGLEDAGVNLREAVVLWPGTTWVTKTWPESSWTALAHALGERGMAVVVGWGTSQEGELAGRIAAASGAVVSPPTTLPELSVLLAQARLLVAGDTGPLHVAVAHGTPTVAVFGATDPSRTGPYGGEPAGHNVVVRGELDCRPCGARQCARGDIACLVQLEVARVAQACERHFLVA